MSSAPQVDRQEGEDDHSIESPDFVTRVLISDEKSYAELEGIFKLTIDGWMWNIEFKTDPEDTSGITEIEQGMLDRAAGKRIYAMTEECVEAHGVVESTLEEEETNSFLLSASIPGGPDYE